MNIKEEIDNLRNLKKECISIYEEKHGVNKNKSFDKTSFCLSKEKNCHGLHFPCYFIHYDGYYGNSSVSSSFSDDLFPYLIKAINNKIETLFYDALDIIESEVKSKKEGLKEEIAQMKKLLKEVEGVTE